jgi:hypothetical protein
LEAATMKKEWFEKLNEIDKANETIIGLQELRPYIYNRTLLYGYTCERETFHVYMKDQKIYTVVYTTDYSTNNPKPKNLRQIEVKSNRDFIPDKRLYPERCDYHFCQALKERGIDLPFTHWSEEIKPNEKGYYGFTLEDYNA